MLTVLIKIYCKNNLNQGLYRSHGSGKLHQLLENPTCIPYAHCLSLQIRPVFVFVMIRVKDPDGGCDSSFLTFMLWKLATTDHCLNDNLTPQTTATPDYRCIQTN